MKRGGLGGNGRSSLDANGRAVVRDNGRQSEEGMRTGQRTRRATGARIALLTVLAVLVGAFFKMQVLHSTAYTLRSEENRLRAIPIPAPRGAIYDRDGRVIAESVPGYSISLLPGPVDSVTAALRRIAPYLDLGPDRQESLLARFKEFPYQPLVLVDDATFEQVSTIEERRPEFRRAVVEMQPRRYYPYGPLFAHAVGYVGEISEAELASDSFAGYDAGRIVGKSGVEKEYEKVLGGTPGVRYVEVDARGSVVSEFGPRPTVPPEPGQDLTLGLDARLQQEADSLFPQDKRGAVVALDPRTGEVLLFYSRPSYDPNDFVGGISSELWRRLRDDPARPLLNRVTGAAYPPGSTWKPVLATIAMRDDVANIHSHMPSPCRGALRYGNRLFRCWKPEGHGDLDMSGAIQQSCDVFFYQLGLEVGLDPMLEGATKLGFGRRTGIDLPYEETGMIPPSRSWYNQRYGKYGWTESVVLNLAIGQGENDETPLRQAYFYAALATGSSPIVPHLLRDESFQRNHAAWSLGLSESERQDLVHALERVVNEPGGTAYAHRLERWTIAGKTGTAQNPHGDPHSWFVAFAPAEHPEIVLAALVENGHPDNSTSLAVPLATRLIGAFLDEQHPAPAVDSVAVPARTAGRAGLERPAAWASSLPRPAAPGSAANGARRAGGGTG